MLPGQTTARWPGQAILHSACTVLYWMWRGRI